MTPWQRWKVPKIWLKHGLKGRNSTGVECNHESSHNYKSHARRLVAVVPAWAQNIQHLTSRTSGEYYKFICLFIYWFFLFINKYYFILYINTYSVQYCSDFPLAVSEVLILQYLKDTFRIEYKCYKWRNVLVNSEHWIHNIKSYKTDATPEHCTKI